MKSTRMAAVLAATTLTVVTFETSHAEPLIYGIQAEQFEYRLGERADVLAWDVDALVGTDEIKFVWRSEAEYDLRTDNFENLENQARMMTPVTPFFDFVGGVRFDTPDGAPDRIDAVIGLHGLAEQWFEVDMDLFLSDHPSARFEVDYEGLITNQIIAVPSIELSVPLADDQDRGLGRFAPKLEVGLRVSYDLVDRAIAPYVGVHYERAFGKTAAFARSEGEDVGVFYVTTGFRLMF